MAKKEFTFRGKTIEELKKLDTREFAKHLRSRQRRTVLRHFNDIEKFIKRCNKKMQKEKTIKTHKRYLVIVPKMVGMSINVYNGREFVPVKIKSQMVGHRLGEFSQTRTKVQHSSPGIGATRSSAALSVR